MIIILHVTYYIHAAHAGLYIFQKFIKWYLLLIMVVEYRTLLYIYWYS